MISSAFRAGFAGLAHPPTRRAAFQHSNAKTPRQADRRERACRSTETVGAVAHAAHRFTAPTSATPASALRSPGRTRPRRSLRCGLPSVQAKSAAATVLAAELLRAYSIITGCPHDRELGPSSSRNLRPSAPTPSSRYPFRKPRPDFRPRAQNEWATEQKKARWPVIVSTVRSGERAVAVPGEPSVPTNAAQNAVVLGWIFPLHELRELVSVTLKLQFFGE